MSVVPYFGTLTIPAATPLSTPVETVIETAPGRLVKARIYVPPGPRGEIIVWLNHEQRQIAPVPPYRYSQVDDDIIDVPLDYDVPINQNEFTLLGASPNANFSHRIDVELLVDTSVSSARQVSSQSLIERLSSFFD